MSSLGYGTSHNSTQNSSNTKYHYLCTISQAVTFAQIPYWILRNPSEVIKTRLRTKLKSTIKLEVGIENHAKNKNSGNINPVSAEVDNIRNAEQKMKKDRRLISVFQDLYTGFSTNLLYALPSDWLKFLAYEFISQHIFGIDIGAGKVSHRINHFELVNYCHRLYSPLILLCLSICLHCLTSPLPIVHILTSPSLPFHFLSFPTSPPPFTSPLLPSTPVLHLTSTPPPFTSPHLISNHPITSHLPSPPPLYLTLPSPLSYLNTSRHTQVWLSAVTQPVCVGRSLLLSQRPYVRP